MKNSGLTLVESLVAIAILAAVGGVLISAIPSFFKANRSSTQDQQITSAARAYMEDIRNQWHSISTNTLSLNAINSVTNNTSGLTASLSIQGKDTDSETLSSIASCSTILTQSCSATSTKQRWTFVLTLSPTGGSSQSYTLEMGRQ